MINQKKHGFTLIELLVVISIIALLLSIMIPSLSVAKKKASMVVCLSNLKQMGTGFYTYSADNKDKVVNGYVHQAWMRFDGITGTSIGGYVSNNVGSWVEPPQSVELPAVYRGQSGYNATLEERKTGIMRGLMYPYINNVDLFHCPADWRLKRGILDTGSNTVYNVFGTYSFPDGACTMEGTPINWTLWGNNYGWIPPMRISQYRNPAMRYVMMEAAYQGGVCNYNDFGWSFRPYLPASQMAWWDPLGNYHQNATTLVFADGHAEFYKYSDKRTITYMTSRGTEGQALQPNNADIKWFQERWPGIRAN